MEESLTDTEFLDITTRDQSKLAKSSKQTGYKEGASDGRASVFQAGFDVGYAKGFANGFTLGRFQGLSAAFKQIDNQRASSETIQLDLLLANPTRGQCQVCIDQQLINKTIPEIIDIQTEHSVKVESTLKQRYNNIENFVREDFGGI